eukprot:CAMPEP_0206426652 /NCGR_PEP_ID=MMETSP0324_2-20121206/4504_1 /ASSEMBLY_ACC=CAM_ASM_000836 /TAXON_ID=2866 /ORGANISM="Crypthecodinium cohnii, Strain Seligo" /LENGTH=311 /DNA_ID=CAMNT_0053891645 /DNA_START=37 /DNA_END=970 /DNA_ORIENTATION=+
MKPVSSTSTLSKRKPLAGGGQHVAGQTISLTRCASTGSTARPLSRTLPLSISALDSSIDVHTAAWSNREAGMANLLVNKSGTLKFGSLPKVGVPPGLSSTSELFIAAIPSSPSGRRDSNSISNLNNSSNLSSSSNNHNHNHNHNSSNDHNSTLLSALSNSGTPKGGSSGAPAHGTTSPTAALVDSLAHTLDRNMSSSTSLVLKADRLARLASPQHTKPKFRGLTSVASSPTFEVQGGPSWASPALGMQPPPHPELQMMRDSRLKDPLRDWTYQKRCKRSLQSINLQCLMQVDDMGSMRVSGPQRKPRSDQI